MSQIIQKRQRLFVVTLGLALLLVMMGALTASAANLIVTPINNNGWSQTNTASSGTASITADMPRDGLGSLRLNGPQNASKADFQKSLGNTNADYTLDKVSKVSFDYYRDSGNGTTNSPIFRLVFRHVSPSNKITTGNLTWEGAYNGGSGTANTWQAKDITNGYFWMYISTGQVPSGCYKFIQNYGINLSGWLSGQQTGQPGDCTPPDLSQGTTYITAINVGFGSGWVAPTMLYVDNVVAEFNANGGTGTPITANFEPNPACYQLTFSHTGNGTNPSPNPTKSPYCGNNPANQFVEGDVVQLTATPDTGWHVSGWSGTDDDSSLATTNTVTVGNAAGAVSVAYTKDTTVTFDAPGSLVCTGPVEMTIDFNDVVGLYGYEFKVSYDATKVNATGAFVDDWFNTASNAFVVWNAACASGNCQFAVSKTNPATPVSGSGTVAKITFSPKSPLAPGSFTAGISDFVLTDIDGFALTPVDTSGATFTVNTCGQATVSGTVSLQGRTTPIDAGTVTFHDNGGNFADSQVAFDASTGAFSATLYVMPLGSTYTMRAHHYLYLGNEKNPLTLSVGGAVSGQNTRLLGGDANNSGRPVNIFSDPGLTPGVDIADLTCISDDFGGSAGNCSDPANGSTDINKDAFVNVQDLSIAGGNYNKNPFLGW